MPSSVQQINDLVTAYLSTGPDRRLNELIKAAPIVAETSHMNRAALRRVFKLLEEITGRRNVLLEEFANDVWRLDGLPLFASQAQEPRDDAEQGQDGDGPQFDFK